MVGRAHPTKIRPEDRHKVDMSHFCLSPNPDGAQVNSLKDGAEIARRLTDRRRFFSNNSERCLFRSPVTSAQFTVRREWRCSPRFSTAGEPVIRRSSSRYTTALAADSDRDDVRVLIRKAIQEGTIRVTPWPGEPRPRPAHPGAERDDRRLRPDMRDLSGQQAMPDRRPLRDDRGRRRDGPHLIDGTARIHSFAVDGNHPLLRRRSPIPASSGPPTRQPGLQHRHRPTKRSPRSGVQPGRSPGVGGERARRPGLRGFAPDGAPLPISPRTSSGHSPGPLPTWEGIRATMPGLLPPWSRIRGKHRGHGSLI